MGIRNGNDIIRYGTVRYGMVWYGHLTRLRYYPPIRKRTTGRTAFGSNTSMPHVFFLTPRFKILKYRMTTISHILPGWIAKEQGKNLFVFIPVDICKRYQLRPSQKQKKMQERGSLVPTCTDIDICTYGTLTLHRFKSLGSSVGGLKGTCGLGWTLGGWGRLGGFCQHMEPLNVYFQPPSTYSTI